MSAHAVVLGELGVRNRTSTRNEAFGNKLSANLLRLSGLHPEERTMRPRFRDGKRKPRRRGCRSRKRSPEVPICDSSAHMPRFAPEQVFHEVTKRIRCIPRARVNGGEDVEYHQCQRRDEAVDPMYQRKDTKLVGDALAVGDRGNSQSGS